VKNSKKLSMVIALALVFGSAVSVYAMDAQEEHQKEEHKDEKQACIVGCLEQLMLSEAAKAEKIKQANNQLFEGLGLNADLNKVVSALKAGADVNCVDHYTGNTPLIDAVEYGHCALVEELLKRGADVTIFNTRGSSALSRVFGCLGKNDTRLTEMVTRFVFAGAEYAHINPDNLLPKQRELLKKALAKRKRATKDLAIQTKLAHVIHNLLPKVLGFLCVDYAAPEIDPCLVKLLIRNVKRARALAQDRAPDAWAV